MLPVTSPLSTPARRLHRAARIEDVVNRIVSRLLRRRGWKPRVLPYTGYGTNEWVRVLGRVLLAPASSTKRDLRTARGWRRFVAITAPGVPLVVEVAGRPHRFVTARGGYVDVVVPASMTPGWGQVTIGVDGSSSASAPVYIVGDAAQVGIVSDIDDTVMITALPRPFLAFWNTFGRHEAARRPVPGMAELYRTIGSQHPDGIVVYLSTGAWNVAPAVESFLTKHAYPPGPLLLTDWGPSPDAFFRSGRAHKEASLRRLIAELPQVSWILIGDDGQHDPDLYCEAAATAPDRISAIAIRELTASQQVRTHGSPEPPSGKGTQAPSVTEVRGPDGFALVSALQSAGVLFLQ